MVMKIWKPVKAVLWTIAAILVLVFREQFVHSLNYLVGSLMVVYGVEACVLHLVLKKSFKKNNRFFWGLLEILLGIVVLCFGDLGESGSVEYTSVCVVWAVWSMLRESLELEESVIEIFHKEPVFLSIAESLVGITLSILLIINPSEHHASTHVILLFFELLTTGLIFPGLKEIVHYVKKKKGIPVEEKE